MLCEVRKPVSSRMVTWRRREQKVSKLHTGSRTLAGLISHRAIAITCRVGTESYIVTVDDAEVLQAWERHPDVHQTGAVQQRSHRQICEVFPVYVLESPSSYVCQLQ